ncbi:MAG: ADP-dependent NAD(P)H-hydrate dehydratase / NAD(P)H-hydrate epimerase [Actinomycetota bacterium]|nr:ADP-dependent NAD(P)H-hydrate dehydratase / NAD(P)H-hydrate epimerase [Actinomycetota bacterium]
MRRAYDVAGVRAAEDALMAQVPEGALMQRAAAGLATVCAQVLGRVYGSRVVLLVGSGNNGGDALFAGARLAERGASVAAVLLSESPHAEGLAALLRAGGRAADASTDAVDRADLVIDGIVGIGGRGPLRDPAAAVVARLDDGPLVVAVDVPSGVDASTGEVSGVAVHADVTVTFGALKPGLVIDPGAAHAGAVELVDIGLGPHLPSDGAVEVLQAADVAALVPRPDRESDKYQRGVLGVAAGSDQYTGAAVLCVGGALRGGAGMVRYVGSAAPEALVRQRWPEVVVGAGRVQAWTVGSGGGGDAADRLGEAFDSGVPVLVDADALTALKNHQGSRPPCLLTPHAGELARLLDVDRKNVEARRLEHARRAAAELDTVVLLKGSTTVIADPSGRVRVNPTGTPALATAGSGDVLAGLGGALLAGGLDPFDAGAAAAWLHGLAGRLASDGGAPISAYDVLDALPRAFRALGN